MTLPTRLFRPLARASAISAAALALGGCSMLPTSLDPSHWYDSVARVVSPNDPPAYGSDKPYPNLSTVPARPTPPSLADRQAVARGLIADRDNANHVTPVPFDPKTLGADVPPPPTIADTPVPAGTPPARVVGTRIAVSQGYTATRPPLTPPKPAAAIVSTLPAGVSQIPPGAPPEPVIPAVPNPPPLAAAPAPDAGKPAPAGQSPLLPVFPEPPPPAPTDLGAPIAPSAFVVPAPGGGLVRSGAAPKPAQVVTVANRSAAAPTGPAAVAGTEPFGPPKPSAPIQTASVDADLTRAFNAKPNDQASPTRSFSSALAAEIFFAPNSCVLTAADREILKAVAGARAQRRASLRVIGYAGQANGTGDIKKKLADFQLAVGRAGAVAEALARYGVDQSSMRVTATDEPTLPRDFAASSEGHSAAALEAALRRAEIFLDY